MKNIIYLTISFFYNLYIKQYYKTVNAYKSTFIIAKVKVSISNHLNFVSAKISNSIFNIQGSNNEIIIKAEHLTKCIINIQGRNNKLIIEKGVGITNGNIWIKGTDCMIKIGEGTTMGGIRIVNVGSNNSIEIGRNCMFSDNIEVWASDTHSIYNEYDQQINHEQPILIKDKVWVGSHVSILKGVTIESGAIIGMNSVVTKSISQNTINVGNPARCVNNNVQWSNKYNTDPK